jgi:hypothetical protein
MRQGETGKTQAEHGHVVALGVLCPPISTGTDGYLLSPRLGKEGHVVGDTSFLFPCLADVSSGLASWMLNCTLNLKTSALCPSWLPFLPQRGVRWR